jgi:hypothetical protein
MGGCVQGKGFVMSEEGEQKFFSREELARRWNVSARTIKRMQDDGRLPGVV